MLADSVLTGARRLVTCSPGLGEGPLGVIENGALAARNGEIIWIGVERDLSDAVEIAPHAAEIDAGGRVVLPGLVDCHTHLVFAGDRSEEFVAHLEGRAYSAGGITATVAATRAATDEELRDLARARLDRFAAHGVTTVEAKSGYGLTPEHERRLLRIAATLDHPVEVVATYLGAHVMPPDATGSADDYIDEVCATIQSLNEEAEFVDAWCDEGAFTSAQCARVLRAGRDAGLGVKIHAEQIQRSGGTALAATLGACSADHLECAGEGDADALAAAGTIAVLLPGASLATGSRFAPARMLIDRGVRVALSTDFNPGTSYSENLQLVVAFAAMHLGMSVPEAILGVTRHAAAALAREGRIGELCRGAACDLVLLDADSEIDLAYHYGVNLCATVVKRGAFVPKPLA
ncbi:MAG: imidazolonepropionase [Actinomycetota bacterium]